MEVQIRVFLVSVLDGFERSASGPSGLNGDEIPRTACYTAGWRASGSSRKEGSILYLPEIIPRFIVYQILNIVIIM